MKLNSIYKQQLQHSGMKNALRTMFILKIRRDEKHKAGSVNYSKTKQDKTETSPREGPGPHRAGGRKCCWEGRLRHPPDLGS